MTSLAARLVRSLRDSALVAPGDRVVAAVSGGSDSVALVFLLGEVAESLGVTLAGMAHLHHGLRGADADLDEEFCRGLALRLALPIHVERMDVGGEARCRRVSVERAGHILRRAFFDRAATALGATVVATGHTLDDQAETFLLRALRGAGRRGLGGMHPRTGRVVRPLLGVRRAQLVDYLVRRGEHWRIDASNADLTIPRNRVRHEIVPVLERAWTPRVVETLARNAALARDEEAWLDEAATTLTAGAVVSSEGSARIARAELDRWPVALGRRVIRRLITTLTGASVGQRAVDAAWRLARRAGPRPIRVAGVSVEADAGRTAVVLRVETDPAATAIGSRAGHRFEASCGVPGMVVDEARGWRIDATYGDLVDVLERPGTLDARLDAAQVGPVLTLRYRRRGDRWWPLGAPGRKPLADYFVDAKTPRSARDDVPVVTGRDGRIVWVVGHRIAEEAKVTPATTGVLLLKASRLGGSG